eukprot:TRINITY_DN10904_c0_g1_i1.p1 TRINITY_DN10904_c0_g1~~TRINITY_DN10904_c0_g1_i1.p1  ORF type:complete len:589 (+),score=197.71 TRINITY_DN10904_c0_g1_i1:129-1895(+)
MLAQSAYSAGQHASESADVGISASVKYVVQQFLEESHYRLLHQVLSQKWSRLHSLSAAMKLMEQHGVVVDDEEADALAALDEAEQIEALVAKMPQQSTEQFEHFFLQLQLLVSTAMRVREALEQGRPEQVEAALADAETTGIAPYILRLAVVQAGTEVSSLRQQYESWVAEADGKLGKLLREQEEALQAQKRLEEAQAQLVLSKQRRQEKGKQALLAWNAAHDRTLLQRVLGSWDTHVKALRKANEIEGEYSASFRAAEGRLSAAKDRHREAVVRIVGRQASAAADAFLEEILVVWKAHTSAERCTQKSVDRLQKLRSDLCFMHDAQPQKAARLVSRLHKASQRSTLLASYAAWARLVEQSRLSRELENQAKRADTLLMAIKRRRWTTADSMMQALDRHFTGTLLRNLWETWAAAPSEKRHGKAIAGILGKAQSRTAVVQLQCKENAARVLHKAAVTLEAALVLRCLNAWRLQLATDRALRKYQSKMDAKRQQLGGVQKMFRNFAKQLETSLNESIDDSPRTEIGVPERDFQQRLARRPMRKDEGSMSLPDIHKHGAAAARQPGGGAASMASRHRASSPRGPPGYPER